MNKNARPLICLNRQTLAQVVMEFFVAGRAQRQSVGDFVAQGRILRPTEDVMSAKLSASFATSLTGETIAREDGQPPCPGLRGLSQLALQRSDTAPPAAVFIANLAGAHFRFGIRSPLNALGAWGFAVIRGVFLFVPTVEALRLQPATTATIFTEVLTGPPAAAVRAPFETALKFLEIFLQRQTETLRGYFQRTFKTSHLTLRAGVAHSILSHLSVISHACRYLRRAEQDAP